MNNVLFRLYQKEMERFKQLSNEMRKPSKKKKKQFKTEYEVSPEMAKVIADRRKSIVIQVNSIKIDQGMVDDVQAYMKSKNQKPDAAKYQRRKSLVESVPQNHLRAEERRKSERRKSQVYEAIMTARRSSLALPGDTNLSKSLTNLSLVRKRSLSPHSNISS